MADLEKPQFRNLFLAQQVDQDSMNALSKSIARIRDHDEYLKKLYKLHDLTYEPKPIYESRFMWLKKKKDWIQQAR